MIFNRHFPDPPLELHLAPLARRASSLSSESCSISKLPSLSCTAATCAQLLRHRQSRIYSSRAPPSNTLCIYLSFYKFMYGGCVCVCLIMCCVLCMFVFIYMRVWLCIGVPMCAYLYIHVGVYMCEFVCVLCCKCMHVCVLSRVWECMRVMVSNVYECVWVCTSVFV